MFADETIIASVASIEAEREEREGKSSNAFHWRVCFIILVYLSKENMRMIKIG